MPSRKISELTRKTNLTGDELVPAAHAGETYAISISSIKSSVTKNDIGLSNVDNTPDVDKPVSALIQQALDGKAESTHTHTQYAATDHTHQEYVTPAASTTVQGKIQIATGTEVATGASQLKAVSPYELKQVTDQLAPVNHTHNEFAASTHNHAISDVTGLSNELNGKASTEHTHSDYSLTTHTHSEYAQTSHVHTGDQITSPTTVIITNVATTNYQLTLSDAGKMLRFTAAGAKAADVSLLNVPTNSIFHMSNRSTAGDLTVVFGGGITGNAPKNGTFVLEPGDTVSIHFVSANLADVYGSTKVV